MEAKQQPECFVTMETGVCEAAAPAEELLSMPLTRWVQWAIEKAFSRPRPQQRLPAHAVCSPAHSTPRRFLGEVVPICYFLLLNLQRHTKNRGDKEASISEHSSLPEKNLQLGVGGSVCFRCYFSFL